MTVNFDEIIDRRGTNAVKLEGYRGYIFHGVDDLDLPYTDEEFIHLWVADMEFAVADEILDAIRERLDRKILGYTADFDDRLYKALNSWCKRRYDFSFDKREMILSDGVVPAINKLISFIVKDGQKVLFLSPSYGQFQVACSDNQREYLTSSLIKDKNGQYFIDFDDLDKKMGQEDVSLFILCNPHNPTGRAFRADELEKIGRLLKKHDLWVISDEIHCDLRRKDAPGHIPLGKIMPTYNKLITCMGPSKSFNIAGLQESAIIIRNEDIRRDFYRTNRGKINPLSHEATIAAYTKAEGWLKEVNTYIDDNFALVNEYLKKELPDLIITPSETTYLAWIDFSKYFEENEDLELFFAKKAGVLIEADQAFVADANRMARLNLACPRSYLKEGLGKMVKAIKSDHEIAFLGRNSQKSS